MLRDIPRLNGPESPEVRLTRRYPGRTFKLLTPDSDHNYPRIQMNCGRGRVVIVAFPAVYFSLWKTGSDHTRDRIIQMLEETLARGEAILDERIKSKGNA